MSARNETMQLSEHVREEIDHWVAKFPEGRQRSAVIAALHAAQHENHGFLTPEIMNGIADYLGLTLETVSRAFSELRRRGVVAIEKQDMIRVNDVCGVCHLTGMH